MASNPESALPERPKDESTSQGPSESANEPSKKAQKKAEKEAQKAKLKAEKAAQRAEQEQQSKAAAEASDISKELYGKLPPVLEGESLGPTSRKGLADLDESLDGQNVTVQVKVYNARVQSAKLGFLMLKQKAWTIQAVVAEADQVSRQMVKWTSNLNRGSLVRVTAIVRKAPEPVLSASISNLELHIKKIYLVSGVAPQLPLQVRDSNTAPPEASEEGSLDANGVPAVTLNTRLNNRVLDLQTPRNDAIFAIQDMTVHLFAEYMWNHGSRQVFSPKLQGTATEGGSDVFEVKYFDKKAYLAQSPQMAKQMFIAAGFESVFEIGPVFRAENSNTHRHMTEFTGLDFELEIYDHYHEVLSFAEDLLVHIISGLQARCKREITTLQGTDGPKAGDFRLPSTGRALRLKYFDGIAILKEAGVDVSKQEAMETDMNTAMEQHLGRLIREKYDTDFYVLDKFPLSVRPFYTMPDPSDPKLSNSYDFFMRGEEIMSGAQRIHDPELLIKQMKRMDPPLDPGNPGFKDYVDAFRFTGCAPHAGGGLGLNRIVQFFLGLHDVREATAFPRDPGRLAP